MGDRLTKVKLYRVAGIFSMLAIIAALTAASATSAATTGGVSTDATARGATPAALARATGISCNVTKSKI